MVPPVVLSSALVRRRYAAGTTLTVMPHSLKVRRALTCSARETLLLVAGMWNFVVFSFVCWFVCFERRHVPLKMNETKDCCIIIDVNETKSQLCLNFSLLNLLWNAFENKQFGTNRRTNSLNIWSLCVFQWLCSSQSINPMIKVAFYCCWT